MFSGLIQHKNIIKAYFLNITIVVNPKEKSYKKNMSLQVEEKSKPKGFF